MNPLFMNSPAYSLIIPAYNESARLGATLDRIFEFVARQSWSAEVIVVNDGSQDSTAELVRQYIQRIPCLRLIENPGNRGKGYSVRNGVLHARGEILIFSDADLSSPIAEAEKLLQALQGGADVAIGSRWARPETMTERQPILRQLFGRIYNLLLRLLLGLKYRDTQCGLKAFTRRAALEVFSCQQIERWGFDPELLFLAQRRGLRVAEIPVSWAHDNRSKINPLLDGMKMFTEILRIRWYSVTGRYEETRALMAQSPQ